MAEECNGIPTRVLVGDLYASDTGKQPERRNLMICNKCGLGHMVDDSHSDIRVYKCWACGNRIYVDHPKRWGYLVCSRCGNDVDEENELGYCRDCLRHLNINIDRVKGRTYGETVCACGTTFIRRSPTQMFHSKSCRNQRS
jgi:DNA-directed RNA polymerase subunit RPC12/RpoP